MSIALTLDTQLNVFETFAPKLSAVSKTAEFLFLANIQPTLQKQVREQCTNAKFVAMDTMNYWITSTKDALIETIKVVDCMIINDAEARQLTDEPNIHKAARKILDYGLKALVIKRGEYGAVLFTKDEFFVVPAYPLESVFDPTGAGDTFAGGFMQIGELLGSYLDRTRREDNPQRRFASYFKQFSQSGVNARNCPQSRQRLAIVGMNIIVLAEIGKFFVRLVGKGELTSAAGRIVVLEIGLYCVFLPAITATDRIWLRQ